MKIRDLQLVELALFKQFSVFAKDYNIKYYALGGTLLGAIRHKGFIPWDDDMDIGIPRGDYERFIKLWHEVQPQFELHTFLNDGNHYRYFSRLEDPSVKLRRHDNIKEELSSAWIDVFPLDGMPNFILTREFHKYHILYRRAMYKLSCFNLGVNVNKKNRPYLERFIIKVAQLFPIEDLLNTKKELIKLDRVLKKYSYNKSNKIVNAMGAYKFNEMFDKRVYGTGKLYSFEDTMIWGPDDYDFICKKLYGDYMTPIDCNHHKLMELY